MRQNKRQMNKSNIAVQSDRCKYSLNSFLPFMQFKFQFSQLLVNQEHLSLHLFFYSLKTIHPVYSPCNLQRIPYTDTTNTTAPSNNVQRTNDNKPHVYLNVQLATTWSLRNTKTQDISKLTWLINVEATGYF